MTQRARRAMICTAGLAAALVAALTAVRRGYLRDHIEAWRFQLARATETIEPAA